MQVSLPKPVLLRAAKAMGVGMRLASPRWHGSRRLRTAWAVLGCWLMGSAFSSGVTPPEPAATAMLSGYRNTLAKPIPAIARNLSGLTYSRATGTLFAVINRPAGLAELSTEGELIRHVPHIAGLHDVEGIAHVQGDLFAVTEEASNRVRWLQVPADGAPRVLALPPIQLPAATFDNLGLVEDIATGSAVGPAAAYLVAQGYASPGVTLPFAQGRFVGRPSHLRACVEAGIDDAWRVAVSGEVCLVGDGQLRVPRAWCEGAAGC